MAPPRLTEGDLRDEDFLYGLIDNLLVQNAGYWKHCRTILRHQHRFQELISEPAFILLLDLEMAFDARTRLMLIESVKWAFLEGKLSSAPDREPPTENS